MFAKGLPHRIYASIIMWPLWYRFAHSSPPFTSSSFIYPPFSLKCQWYWHYSERFTLQIHMHIQMKTRNDWNAIRSVLHSIQTYTHTDTPFLNIIVYDCVERVTMGFGVGCLWVCVDGVKCMSNDNWAKICPSQVLVAISTEFGYLPNDYSICHKRFWNVGYSHWTACHSNNIHSHLHRNICNLNRIYTLYSRFYSH